MSGAGSSLVQPPPNRSSLFNPYPQSVSPTSTCSQSFNPPDGGKHAATGIGVAFVGEEPRTPRVLIVLCPFFVD